MSRAQKMLKRKRNRKERLENFRKKSQIKKGFTNQEKSKGKLGLYILLILVVVVSGFVIYNMR